MKFSYIESKNLMIVSGDDLAFLPFEELEAVRGDCAYEVKKAFGKDTHISVIGGEFEYFEDMPKTEESSDEEQKETAGQQLTG